MDLAFRNEADGARLPGPLAGMSTAVRQVFRGAMAAPAGLVLVAGPAGPAGAATLRAGSALRPDALCVEAIGDREGAAVAAQAALSGRLVLAAIDADDAVGAIARLRSYGVEPFLIAATLRAAVAQWLVRRLCPDCRRPVQADAGTTARLGFDPGAVVHEAPGCASCGDEGYQGLHSLFEIVEVDRAMGRLIGSGGDAAVIASHAFRDRPNLAGAARAAVLEGEISPEDAARLS